MISITSGEYTTSQPEKFSIVAVTRQFPSGALAAHDSNSPRCDK